MKLGAYSLSLNVKDLQASKAFYEKLGFQVFGGEEAQNWLIMKNNNCTIGLFQGMFAQNILTFNPGWDQNAAPVSSFTDVRELRQGFEQEGISIESETDETGSGPASFIIRDPDGNTILFDQHV